MSPKRPEAPRTERMLPGVWRLRLPLPWPGVQHGNVWAIAADGGVVLFDTGMGGRGRLRQFDLALAQAGFGLEDVRLLVCTHSHTDHYGLADLHQLRGRVGRMKNRAYAYLLLDERRHLSGDAANAPLVTTYGNRNQLQLGLGVTYSFDIKGFW